MGDGALAVDLMETENGYTVHEINCSMEFKGSMEALSLNIPGMIVDYCVSQAKEN